MDNGQYEKYRLENPVVNTPLSTYDHVEVFVTHLTKVELVVCIVFAVIAGYAVFRVIQKMLKK